MSRTYFPTSNSLGVRNMNRVQTLGAVRRDPAAAAPKAAMNPVTLGVAPTTPVSAPAAPAGSFQLGPSAPIQIVGPVSAGGALPTSLQTSPTPTVNVAPATPQYVFVTSGGGSASLPSPASPTAPVGVPTTSPYAPAGAIQTLPAGSGLPAPPSGYQWLTNADGTQSLVPIGTQPVAASSVAAPAAAATSLSVTDQVASWLSGSTVIAGYSIPNALFAGVVVLGFALLSSGGKKR